MTKKEALIDIAIRQVGYKEGKNNNNKYGKYFNMNNVSWCALFVSWCARQVKIPTDVIPTYSGCGTGYNFFKKQGRIYKEPMAGDIVFYKPTKLGATSSHTGIVVNVSDEYVTTIEGNASVNTDGVYQFTYRKDYDRFLGFGRPNYGDEQSLNYQVYDNVKKYWLPNVSIMGNQYAGNFGNPISGVYIDKLEYRVHDKKKKKWLPVVKGRSDYAGNLPNNIDGIAINSKDYKYRVHLRKGNRWLAWVDGYNTKDKTNGYAGNLGEEIDGLQIAKK